MTAADVIKLIDHIADIFHDARGLLSSLDRDIGDGDHGVAMDVGWAAVQSAVHQLEQPRLSDVFRAAGDAFLDKVGATVGPLYATMFLAIGKLVRDKDVLTDGDVGPIFRIAVESLQKRGKANVGDKTMMDVWIPALQAFQENERKGLQAAALAAATAGRSGAERTKDMVAVKGRASYLGQRSVGHVDPGAQSALILLESVIEWIRAKEGEADAGR